MASFISTVYFYWQKVNPGIRAGISLFVMGILGAVLAFGWTWPSDWVNFTGQIHAFWILLVPAVYALFQKDLWPPVLAYVLKLFGLTAAADKKSLVAK